MGTLRALWINKSASAEEIDQAAHDTLRFPTLRRMLGQIKQSYFLAKKDEELTPGEGATAVWRQFLPVS